MVTPLKKRIALPSIFYLDYLQDIQGYNFTQREIDIISCLLNGRAAKKIASFLNISSRTVETHIRNIMDKIDCHSKECIIDFIERSDKYTTLKLYYSAILILKEFENTLKLISKTHQNTECEIVYLNIGNHKNDILAHQIKLHLELAGFHIKFRSTKGPRAPKSLTTLHNSANTICILPSKQHLHSQIEVGSESKARSDVVPKNIQYLILEKYYEEITDQAEAQSNNPFIDIDANYFFSLHDLLLKLLPNIKFHQHIVNFKSFYEKHLENIEYQTIPKHTTIDFKKIKDTTSPLKINILKNQKYFITALVSVFIISIICLTYWSSIHPFFTGGPLSSKLIRSDLIIPKESVFLNRPELLVSIENKLNSNTCLQTVALIGMGGMGKTTLARQYARKQKARVIWELNAETVERLKESFEYLASALSETEENKKTLQEIRALKNTAEREEKIINYVREQLKTKPSWLLIYDNLEDFSEIQKFFPHNKELWGNGKVIITTRDKHIQSNSLINDVVYLEDFTQEHKLALFLKIMYEGKPYKLTDFQKEETIKFLDKLPPFPLDISIAAYYLKATNISFAKYLQHLENYNLEFSQLQINVLKEAGGYLKTRYSIITIAIKELIDHHPDLWELLLFCSLLDSQHIPKDLLDKFKKDVAVDNFIYLLKRYSLITDAPLATSSVNTGYSIHRSTQEIIRAYLTKRFKLVKDHSTINKIASTIENYTVEAINNEDLRKLKILQRHLEKFITHKDLMNLTIIGSLEGELGFIHLKLGNYIKAKEITHLSLEDLNKNSNVKDNETRIAHVLICLGNVYKELENYESAKNSLEKSLILLKQHFPENHINIAENLTYLGNIYAYSRDYERAIEFLERSISIYNRNSVHNQIKVARALAYLGYIHRRLGNYEKARSLLERSLLIYKQYYPNNHVKIAQILGYLGALTKSLGHYEKARDLIEQTLQIYKVNYSQDHVDIAWSLTHLGNIYMYLGDFEKAKYHLEQSIKIYEKNSYKVARYALALRYLGNVYSKMGNQEKAKSFLEQSLSLYKKKCNHEYIEVAQVFRDLGKMYFLKGENETGEKLIQKSLDIFQQNNHPESHTCLECLADLNVRQSTTMRNNRDSAKSIVFREHAIKYLVNDLIVLNKFFPERSPHIIRIQEKLKKLIKPS